MILGYNSRPHGAGLKNRHSSVLLQPESQRRRFRDGSGTRQPRRWMDGCGFAQPFVFLLFLLSSSSSSSSNPSTYPASDSLLHGGYYSLHYSHLCSSRHDMSESSHWRKGLSDLRLIRPCQVFCLLAEIKLRKHHRFVK